MNSGYKKRKYKGACDEDRLLITQSVGIMIHDPYIADVREEHLIVT